MATFCACRLADMSTVFDTPGIASASSQDEAGQRSNRPVLLRLRKTIDLINVEGFDDV